MVQDWLLNGYRLIFAKQELHRNGKESSNISRPESHPEGDQYKKKKHDFGKACEDLSWNHCTSTYHRSATHGVAERAVVRRVREGTSAELLQSGSDEKWWVDPMECYCFLRSVQDPLSDGKTPYEPRFGEPFSGPIIPFGSMIEKSSDFCKRLVEAPPFR